MSNKFYHGISQVNISKQVAGLLNDYNNLSTKRSGEDLAHSRVSYVVETHGKWVIGAIGIDRQSYTFTEIKHLVIHPQWRGKGIAKFLIKRALNISDTRMAYATVRDDNYISLEIFEKLGFSRAESYVSEDHKVIILARVTPRWEKVKPQLKASWLEDEEVTAYMAAETLKRLDCSATTTVETG